MAELDEDIALVQAELDAADHAATDALARFGQHPLQVFRSFYGVLSDGGQSSLEITLRFGVCTRHRAGGQPLSGVGPRWHRVRPHVVVAHERPDPIPASRERCIEAAKVAYQRAIDTGHPEQAPKAMRNSGRAV